MPTRAPVPQPLGSHDGEEVPLSLEAASAPKARRWKKEKADGDSSRVVAPLPQSNAGTGDGEGVNGKGHGKGVNNKGGEVSGNVQVPLSMDKTSFDGKAPLQCSMMSQEEVDAITVPFDDIETRLSSVLARHGAAVVTGVANEEDCGQLEAMFSEDLQELIDREALEKANAAVAAAADTVARDPRAWPAASMKGLGNINRCQLRGLPHGRFAWAARLNPRVRRTYEVLHGTNELVSSCDNSFFAPGSSPEEDSNRNWPHVDHNKHDNSVVDEDGTPISDWDVYQGLLYVWPSTDSRSSTTVVWTGSHTDVYEEMMSKRSVTERGRKGNHFTQILPFCPSLIPQWHAAARRVPVPAGALFLWSSRLLHQGWTGGPRLAQPVCWEPRSRRTEAARERKLRMAALGLPSTHWGSLGLPHMLVTPCLQPKLDAGGDGDDVTLPMVETLRPVTLADGVQAQEMWQQLAAADWSKRLPAPLMEVLERSVASQFQDVL